MTRIGIITCENQSILCAGQNCFRALSQRSGTFAQYVGDIEVVGFTTCGGCPGYLAAKKAESMIKYGGAEKIHLAWCIFPSRPNPNRPQNVLKLNWSQSHPTHTRLNQDDLIAEKVKLAQSGQIPHVCYFNQKIQKDIEMLGVEVIKGTHAQWAADIKESSSQA